VQNGRLKTVAGRPQSDRHRQCHGDSFIALPDGKPATLKARESTRALMPDGLVNAMSNQDFFDLVAYLETLKVKGRERRNAVIRTF